MMAHELAHVKHHDTLIMTLTATIAGAISMLANFGFLFGGNRENNNPLGFVGVIVAMIVAPLAAMLVQMAISAPANCRRPHGRGDLRQPMCGSPRPLPNWSGGAHRIVNAEAEANPATPPTSSSSIP